MPFDTLTEFLGAIEDDGELVRVSATVDPRFELTEICDRLARRPGGGPAVLFENVAGHRIPVVANLLGSIRRLCRMLGSDSLDGAAGRLTELVNPDVPDGWLETLRRLPQLAQLSQLRPRLIKSGVGQQVVKLGSDIDLGELPIPHGRPGEAGPTLTAAQVYTVDPETGLRSVSHVPLLLRGKNRLSVLWTRHEAAWRQLNAHRQRRRQMPVALVLGGDPAVSFAGHAPLPPRTDPLLLAGLLRRRAVEVVRCRSLELDVPAGAEIVLEGLIDPTVPPEPVGSVALDTGFYTLPDEAPTIEMTGMTHRSNPVLPVIVPGRPPSEASWIAGAVERMIVPLVKLAIPELVDLHLPVEGSGRNIAFLSVRKDHAGQARRVMHALWGLGRLATVKLLVVVDADVNVHDPAAVWFEVGANVHPGRDAIFCEGPTHMDDHASPTRGMGHKLGLDATRKLPEEGHPRPWPERLTASEDILRLVDRRWREYGFDPPADGQQVHS